MTGRGCLTLLSCCINKTKTKPFPIQPFRYYNLSVFFIKERHLDNGKEVYLLGKNWTGFEKHRNKYYLDRCTHPNCEGIPEKEKSRKEKKNNNMQYVSCLLAHKRSQLKCQPATKLYGQNMYIIQYFNTWPPPDQNIPHRCTHSSVLKQTVYGLYAAVPFISIPFYFYGLD